MLETFRCLKKHGGAGGVFQMGLHIFWRVANMGEMTVKWLSTWYDIRWIRIITRYSERTKLGLDMGMDVQYGYWCDSRLKPRQSQGFSEVFPQQSWHLSLHHSLCWSSALLVISVGHSATGMPLEHKSRHAWLLKYSENLGSQNTFSNVLLNSLARCYCKESKVQYAWTCLMYLSLSILTFLVA